VAVSLTGAAARTTTTDSSGCYAFTDLADGTYTATPAKAGYNFSPASRTAAVSEAAATGMDFSVSTFVAAGTVTGASAVRVTAVACGVTIPDFCGEIPVPADTATTDAAGRYALTLTPLAARVPPAYYVIRPGKTGYTFSPASYRVGGPSSVLDFVATPTPP
jgi:hypothetical protein